MASRDAAPITFLVPGQRLSGETRGASPVARTPPLGLHGELTQSVRVAGVRSGGNLTKVVAQPGVDVVVLHVAKGPSLVLHPETARDLLMAQTGRPVGPSRGGGAADALSNTVEVGAQLHWKGLEDAATASGTVRRGSLGDVLLTGIDVVARVFKGRAEDIATKALIDKIDGQVDEGVYALRPEKLGRLIGETKLARLPEAKGKPVLCFVHGTFSETSSGFEKLWNQHPERVRTLFEHYGDRVYAFDHATLGLSPIENALNLVKACPPGTRLHLVTHSRGGLVAEVLARAGGLRKLSDDDLAFFDGEPLARQRAALVTLVDEMSSRRIKVERILRVACPARGTFLASKRFDAYLSVFVWSMRIANVPLLPGLLDFLGGVAQRRQDPTEMPGLAAMIPDSPLIQWLHASEEPVTGDLRVVAGDMDGDSLGSWIKTLMADAFYWTDNDLVVQTRSMYGGVPRAGGANFVLDQGGKVTHFNYFGNARTAEAVVDGLLREVPPGFLAIGPLSYEGKTASGVRAGVRAAGRPGVRGSARAGGRNGAREGARAVRGESVAAGTRPAVFLLPGILGSNLKVNDKRVWLGPRLINGLKSLAYPDAEGIRVEPDGPLGRTYDKLAAFLSLSHDVIEFAFDWRKPIETEAARLGEEIDAELELRKTSGKPVRIIAHSMGGLVARALELARPETWARMMSHPEARVLMLGTPNAGSWAPMQVLSGDDDFGNTLIAFGAPFQDHSARQMMAQFPGFLQLQAALLDEARGLAREETWMQLANDDLARVRQYNWWHADERQLIPYRWGVPEQVVLDQAVALRRKFDAQLRDWLPKYKDRLLVVVGKAPFTPEGFEVGDEGLTYLNGPGTGDGRVSLESALLPGVSTWQVDAIHGKLPEATGAFDAYLDLLQSGATSRLEPHADVSRGAVAAAHAKRPYAHVRLARQPMALVVPQSEEAVTQLPAAPAAGTGRDAELAPLEIDVLNADLRFVREPLLVGHYRSSVLLGSEYVVNQLIGGTMEQALAMGQYPNDPKTHQLFVNRGGGSTGLDPAPRPEAVVVVGLGEEGKLDAACLVASVSRGVLAFAQRAMEKPEGAPAHFELAATLLGSGGVGIGPGQAAQLIAQGVREANLMIRHNNRRRGFMLEQRRHVGDLPGPVEEPAWPPVARLLLVERYLDRAAEAWRALRTLTEASTGEFKVCDAVAMGAGALRRTLEGGYRGSDYDLISAVSSEDAAGEKKILYTIDTKRARSEVRAQSTQLRLVRDLVGKASTDQASDDRIGSTLFRLLVPLELEPFLGGNSETRLELDSGTAGIPWEMLDTDTDSGSAAGRGQPWAIRTKLLRRLRVDEFRQRVADASADANVLVIGEPRTDPIYPRLPGARLEALAVADLLTAPGVLGRGQVTSLISSEDAAVLGPDASEIITALLSRDWRIVHIAGHGEPPERIVDEDRPGRSRRRDGATRGVVLSNDIFLGPREVDSMRVVPELVFVNCCHLAARNSEQLLQTQGDRDYDRAIFASGVAEQLIKIGVRCVIAAGWAVEDGPAMTFAKAFYGALLQGQRFIDAVHAARKAARDSGGEGGKTWAAYQCYGDPGWVFRREVGDAQVPVAPRRNEFADMASPPSLTLALETVAVEARLKPSGDEVQRDRIRQLEASFRFKWGDIGAVAEAFAVAWAATGARIEAIAWYEKAVAANDGSASLNATEQLANLKVLQAWESFDAVRRAQQAVDGQPATAAGRAQGLAEAAAASRTVIRDAIADIDRLLALHPTLERHSLRGSANKRLAMIERAVGAAEAEKEALSSMADDYVKAEGAAASGDARTGPFYPLQNRLSAEAALRAGLPDWKGPEDKEVARLRQSLLEKSRDDPDFWGLVGLTELQILEALPKHDLAQRAHGLTRELADLHRRVTAPAYWTSVCDQMEFLLGSYEGRVDNEAEREAVRTLQSQVRGYATLQ